MSRRLSGVAALISKPLYPLDGVIAQRLIRQKYRSVWNRFVSICGSPTDFQMANVADLLRVGLLKHRQHAINYREFFVAEKISARWPTSDGTMLHAATGQSHLLNLKGAITFELFTDGHDSAWRGSFGKFLV